MKNHIFSIGLLAALAISCSIHEMDFKDANAFEEFYASIENAETPDTKVFATEELYLRWNADDRITIFNKYTYNQEYRFTGETGDNSGSFKKVFEVSAVSLHYRDGRRERSHVCDEQLQIYDQSERIRTKPFCAERMGDDAVFRHCPYSAAGEVQHAGAVGKHYVRTL